MVQLNRERLISTFIDLVKIPSPSWNETEIIEYLIKRFKKLDAEIIKFPCGNSFNLLVRFKGNTDKKSILLSAHMDTVVPCEKITPLIEKDRITSDGTSVLGADDKAAIAIILETLHHVIENKLNHPPIELLFSCAEEVGLEGIKCFDMKELNSKMAFVFDNGGAVGKVIVKAPYHETINIGIKGKAAHAGMAPEQGINAINILAEIIVRLPSGRLDDETTMNIGTIQGGKATNIVAENAECKLEIRSINISKLKKYDKQVKSEAKKITRSHKAKITINSNMEYSGFALKNNEPVVMIAVTALKKIGIKAKITSSGGGSDTNIFNKSGIKAVNLSCGMQKIHTTGEFIYIADLIKGARLVLSIIETV
jgi:tripeptide aminopeptidase